jgi:hypothetical protein
MSTAITPLDVLTPSQARRIMRMGTVPAFEVDEYLHELGQCDCANDLAALRGGRAACLRCQSPVPSGKQIWKCYACATCRVWGLEQPLDTSTAKLNCIRCTSVTPHRFMLVTRNPTQCKEQNNSPAPIASLKAR